MTWWQFDLWKSIASLAAGILVISPLLLFPKFRKRFWESDIDIEAIGLLVLVVAIIAIGVYNNLKTGSAA